MAQSDIDRLPPNAPEAELGILACVMLSPERIDECQIKIKSKAFYDLRYRKIYEMLCAMRTEGDPIDIINLQTRLGSKGLLDEVGGLPLIASLPDQVPSAENLSSYLETVTEKHTLRQVIQTCDRASDDAYRESDQAITLIGRVQTEFYGLHAAESDTSDAKKCAVGLVDELQRRFELNAAGKRSGISTGFHQYDELTDGIQFAELTIVAARPSIGKTAFALNVVRKVCLVDKIPTAIFTLEMGRNALMTRMLSDFGSIAMNSIRKGAFTQGEFSKFSAFSALVRESPLFIHDGVGGMNIDEVAATMRRLVRTHGIKLFVLDYLQRIKGSVKHEKKTYEVGEVSSTLKAIAEDTNTGMLVMCRVNRESEKEKGKDAERPANPPKLSDLSDSGQIEYDGDVIGLLHRQRQGKFQHEAQLGIAKQRQGDLGFIKLHWNGMYCRFENPSPQDADTTL